MKHLCATLILVTIGILPSMAQLPVVPSSAELNRPFGSHDLEAFRTPPKVYHPETWFHYIGGNVATKGITADLEAISGAGFSGIQFFHGQFGGPWPGVDPQIACLSPLWDNAVRHTALSMMPDSPKNCVKHGQSTALQKMRHSGKADCSAR